MAEPESRDLPLFGLQNQRETSEFKRLLSELLAGYEFDVMGLYIKGGDILPLPSESAVVGKVIEGSILQYLRRRLLQEPDLDVISAASSRTYPDLTFRGSRIHPRAYAVDVKCARRKNSERIVSAIAIGTYDAEYFHYPNEKVANIEAPYSSYSAHLSMIALYDYAQATARDVELLVVEKWRVARRAEASGTRSYVATTTVIEELRSEQGDFESEDEYNKYWRSRPVKPSKLERWRRKRAGA